MILYSVFGPASLSATQAACFRGPELLVILNPLPLVQLALKLHTKARIIMQHQVLR